MYEISWLKDALLMTTFALNIVVGLIVGVVTMQVFKTVFVILNDNLMILSAHAMNYGEKEKAKKHGDSAV